ncbi:hypothetical protein GWK26_12430 [haloarchaeon 3A1-DGR]|nr:hypothetical protein GWK26_12430 [haloarchaeon 3A1-DGR]
MSERNDRDDRGHRDGSDSDEASPNEASPNEASPNEAGPNEAGPNEAGPNGAPPDEFDSRIDALADDEAPEAALEDDPFEAMDVDVGETDVWAALETDDPDALDRAPETVTASEVAEVSETAGTVGDSGTTRGASAKPDAGESAEADWAGDAEYDDRIVDKREYCQRCPYSTDPPTLACTHDGTEIVEVVEMDRFRVRNCPMVSTDGPTFDRVNE